MMKLEPKTAGGPGGRPIDRQRPGAGQRTAMICELDSMTLSSLSRRGSPGE
jgi:hypothetical protein